MALDCTFAIRSEQLENSKEQPKAPLWLAILLTCQRETPAWRGVAWRGVAWRGVAWRAVACRGFGETHPENGAKRAVSYRTLTVHKQHRTGTDQEKLSYYVRGHTLQD